MATLLPPQGRLLTTSAINTIFRKELGGQREPVGAILHGELQEKATEAFRDGATPLPHPVSLYPTQGHKTQLRVQHVALGLSPTWELKNPISEVRSLGSAK